MPRLFVSFVDPGIDANHMPGKNRGEKLIATLDALKRNDESCRLELLAWLHDEDPNASFDDKGVLSANHAAIAKLESQRPDYIENINEPIETGVKLASIET